MMMVLVYALSVYYLGRTDIARKIVKEEEKQAEKAIQEEIIWSGKIGTAFKLLSALALLILGARLTVVSVVEIGESLGIALEVLGATVVSVGTTLPELSLELNSVKHKEYELAVGDIFGSTLVNLTLVLGLLSLVSHPHVATLPLTGALLFIGAALVIIWFYLFRDHEIDSREGWLLVSLFALYLVQEYGLAGAF